MPFWFYDPTFLLVIPALILGLWAGGRVRSAYAKYSKVEGRSGLTGADVAQHILNEADIEVTGKPEAYPAGGACRLERIGGDLSDQYDPRTRTLRLSDAVYYGRNVAALGVAAHEAGHAIQHARLYTPLMLRSVMYPVSNLGSHLAFPLFIAGLLVPPWHFLLRVAIVMFTIAVFFTVVTLPVEFNASKRALAALERGGYLAPDELAGARKVLRAAALTYVAAAAMAVTQLLRMLIISRGRR